MPNPISDLWDRIRDVGREVEEEIYDFTEEEELEEEPRGRNALIALINAFFTLWKASHANVAERTFGLLGFAGLLWLVVGDRGLGVRRSELRVASSTFAALWFVPGLIASAWTLAVNLGWSNLRRPRTLPLLLVLAMGGLITFKGVFADLAAQHPRRIPQKRNERTS